MIKKSYHKPTVVDADKTRQAQSIQLAGVRAIQVMLLKTDLTKKQSKIAGTEKKRGKFVPRFQKTCIPTCSDTAVQCTCTKKEWT